MASANFRTMWRLPENSVAAYMGAVVIAAAAVLLRLWMAPYVGGVPFIAFFPAVVLSAYVCGQRPGLVTVVLCGIAAWYFLTPPYRSFELQAPQQYVPLATYLVTSSVIALIVGRMRLAIEREGTALHDLAASEAQFRLLADSSPALIWVTDENAQVTFANRRYEEVFGRPADEIKGEGWRGIVHPDDVQSFNTQYLAAHAARERFYGDVRVHDHKGDLMWLHCEGIPRFGGDGRFLGYVGANLDVTDGKIAQQRLGELNAMLKGEVVEANAERQVFADIVESTPAAIMALDAHFNILAANCAALAALESMYGKRAKLNDNLVSLFEDAPEHVALVHSTWGRALAGEDFVIVNEFGDEGRQRSTYEVRFNVLRDREGRVIGAAQTAFDVTERIRSQHELEKAQASIRQSQKMDALGQLAGGIAHDFNNMLSVVTSAFDILRRRLPDPDPAISRYIDAGQDAASRAAELTQRMLAFARKEPAKADVVNVNAAVTSVRELLVHSLGKGIRLEYQLANDLWPVMVDRSQLENAVLNLAINARDAMCGSGEIKIEARNVVLDGAQRRDRLSGDFVELSVSDNGAGMTPEVRTKVFEPFFTTKPAGQGTGLGLSQVYGFVRQADGNVEITSELGKGTRIDLYLPRAS